MRKNLITYFFQFSISIHNLQFTLHREKEKSGKRTKILQIHIDYNCLCDKLRHI